MAFLHTRRFTLQEARSVLAEVRSLCEELVNLEETLDPAGGSDIACRHSIDEGFAGRRPISEP